jgi:hypothetical protein
MKMRGNSWEMCWHDVDWKKIRRFVKQAISNLLHPPGIDARPSSTTKQFAATVFWGPAYLQIAFGHNLSITKDSWFSQ